MQNLISSVPGIVQGEPWYQGDHYLFIQNNIPALGVTSERMEDILAVAYTPRDLLPCRRSFLRKYLF